MKKTILLAAAVLVLAACGCGKPQTLPVIPSGQESGNGGGKETIPEPGITYATEVLTLPATARDHYQIYQVNLKLYGNSGAFGKVQARLDEIKALGTDILYLMPVYAEGKDVLPGMPGNKPFGSPYCIRNYKEVNSLYGTLDELKALVDAAKAKGMKVMFDWVANHTSWDNVWITEHPEWYEHKADGSIAWPTKDGEWKDVAQLDYGKKELWAAMEDALEYWVTEVGIDGYRCDYAHGVRDDFWKEAIGKLKALKPGFVMLAESDFERMFDDGFDIIFDRAMKRQMMTLVGGGSLSNFASWYKGDQDKAPAPKTKLYFITNHDDATTDTPAKQFKSLEGGLAAYVLMAGLNGSSMIYGCQEAGNNKTINFFNTQTFNWNAMPEFTRKYQEAMQAVSKLNRKGACKLYESGRVLFVLYENGGLLAVNVSGSEVEANFPEPVSGKNGVPASQKFDAYQFQIWE